MYGPVRRILLGMMGILALSLGGVPLARQCRADSLPTPDIFIEGAWRPPDLGSSFYDTPNVYFFDRRDPRSKCDASGNSGWVLPVNRTPLEHAQDIFNGQAYLRSTFERRWKNVGKPFRYAVLLVGLNERDCTVARLGHHPGDQPSQFLFYRQGWEETSRYYRAALTEFKRLIDRSPGASYPEAILDDNEISPDANGSFAKGVPGGNDEQQGYWAAAQRDPRFNDPAEFTGAQTLRDWALSRTTLLNGSPIPRYSQRFNGYNPNNWDAQATAGEAVCRAVLEAHYQSLGKPVADLFGPAVVHGSWQMSSRSRAFPVELRPTQYLYNLNGDFPLGAQIVVNYSNPPAFRAETDPAVRAIPDPRWETLSNYTRRARELGANIPAGASSYEQEMRAGTFFREREAYAAYHATPGTAFWVSIQIDAKGGAQADPMSDPNFVVRANCMIDYLVYCVNQCGLANGGIWMFEPGYDNDASIRAQVQTFIRMLRAAFDAGQSPIQI